MYDMHWFKVFKKSNALITSYYLMPMSRVFAIYLVINIQLLTLEYDELELYSMIKMVNFSKLLRSFFFTPFF